ncbi:MAG: hypothetical protein GY725_23415 [bacterium]|nr:hypothetical protein [bacterium]
MQDREELGHSVRARSLAVLLAGLVLACGGGGDSADAPASEVHSGEQNGHPVRGDWMVRWLLADPENLNPLTSNDASSNSILSLMMAPLLTLDNQTLEQRPVIASLLPEISEDKLTYTFRLRDDVTFADGKLLSAEDVVFTMKAIKNPEVMAPQTRNYFDSVRDVVAVDKYTVRFDLRKRYFRNTLVLGSIQPLPRHFYDPDDLMAEVSIPELDAFDKLTGKKKTNAQKFAKQFNEQYDRKVMGAGAFTLKDPKTDIITGERILLTRRPDFWAPEDPELGDAYVDKILFRVINDKEAALVSFKGRDIDVMGLTPIQHKRQTGTTRFEAQAQKKEHVSPGYTYIGWNAKKPIFSDVRVRRALRYFIDKQSIIDKVLLGLGVPVEGSIFIGRSEYNKSLPGHEFDPEKGKKLLAEAGWKDSDGDGVLDKTQGGKKRDLVFEIISNSGNDIRKAIGLVVIDEMKRAGIGASFREIDWGIMLEQVRGQKYDAVILGWQMGVVSPDPYQLWHSSQAVQGGSNHVSFKNDEVDQLLEDYRVEFDPARRKKLIDRFQMILFEEQPYAFLFMKRAVTAWDRRFHGVTWYPSESTDLGEWWVPKNEQKYN